MTSWTEADALATTKPPPPHGALKQCSCGVAYTADEWFALSLVGYMPDGDGGILELKNCPCGSTISRRVRRAR